MSRARWLGLTAVVAISLGGGLLWWNHHREHQDEGAARAPGVDELEIKLARLQGKMAALEARASAPPPAQPGAAAAAPEQAAAPVAAPVAPPHRRTRAEVTATFEGYFGKLDALRGKREDAALTKQFADSLGTVKPDFKALHAAKVDSVSCGNGLCRVEVTFANVHDLDTGKSELQFQIGTMSGATTMYSDGESNRLFAYFAAPGTDLPPYPKD